MDFRDIEAVQTILKTLKDFEQPDQERIIRWVSEKLGVSTPPPARPAPNRTVQQQISTPTNGERLEQFQSLGEALAAVCTNTGAERVLVVATYLQYRAGKETLTGLEINYELKHLGYRVANITDTIETLQRAKPSLMIQTKKQGTSRQGRKMYRVTDAGLRRVLQMLEEGVAGAPS